MPTIHLSARDQRRFWSKIETRGRPAADAAACEEGGSCHKWKGSIWDGTALYWLHGGRKYIAAHRLLFILRKLGKLSIADIDGPLDVNIPKGGRTNFFCSTEGCMNPEHFYIDW